MSKFIKVHQLVHKYSDSGGYTLVPRVAYLNTDWIQTFFEKESDDKDPYNTLIIMRKMYPTEGEELVRVKETLDDIVVLLEGATRS